MLFQTISMLMFYLLLLFLDPGFQRYLSKHQRKQKEKWKEWKEREEIEERKVKERKVKEISQKR